MKDIPPFIKSLHRPFSQQLKACKWVCLFINKNEIKSSSLNIEFYLYMVNKLEKEYKNFSIDELNGLPSQEGIIEISKIFKGKIKEEKILIIKKALHSSERSELLDRQLYSSYKAASYYINMTKDKLKLITKENKLNKDGEELLSLKSNYFSFSEKEKYFFFRKLVEVDFLLIMSLCLFKRLSYEYKLKNYTQYQYDFLSKFYRIRYFKFTSKSLDNYNTVRSYWIDSLDILDKNLMIKKSYLNYIKLDQRYNEWYTNMNTLFDTYKKDNFKKMVLYQSDTKKLEIQYDKCLKEGKGDLGFVNLYDIKASMRMSDEKFQQFLEAFYENEKGSKHIFFSNIVNSIDRRKRFEVRGVPVLKIKIKRN